MTSLVESVNLVGETNSLFSFDSYANTYKNRQHRHVLKSKEIAYRHKCNKVLRRKLKKYKLRQDGGEDQDVLDVSRILVSSLIIKSPHNLKEPTNTEGDYSNFEELRPKNYLFKMVRRNNVKLSETPDKPEISDFAHDQRNEPQSPEVVLNQEKKQTNAFKLLMDSRNKSIGCNSPGKEKNIDGSDDEEFIEKKNIKAKRNMLLQKMAEAKGSLKRKEMEEYQEECIKRKIEKRAEKFKSMILNDKKVSKKNMDGITIKEDSPIKDCELDCKVDETVKKVVVKKHVKTLQIVDIFNSLEEPIVISHETKHISKEDKEFLKKLSPSLKKKESMLSYFKKLGKESEDSADNLIKVKFGTKTRKKGKKKKLSINRNVSHDILLDSNDENDVANQNTIDGTPVNECVDDRQENIQLNSANERQKRKRSSQANIKSVNIEAEAIVVPEDRPKRSVKRPVKYIDDAVFDSSDEELHIFTPKKKKHKESVTDCKLTQVKSDETYSEHVKPKPDKKVVKDKSELKKPVKIAPIFKKQSVDPAALEAKQKFLQSGVPDKLKKIINQQKNNIIIESTFPIVIHVQQKEATNAMSIEPCLNIAEFNFDEHISVTSYEGKAFKKLLNFHQINSISNLNSNMKRSTSALLQTIKELYPKFPVYRTYRYLKGKSKGEFKDFNYIELDNSIEIMNGVVDVTSDSPDRLNWTNKFKALSANQIIGNFDSVKELRKWLVSWTENEMRSKTKTTCNSDSSDYYQSDTDSRESGKSMNNLLILTGPTGSGKTSSVYAVAAELAMKVLEVNTSSKRTGKIMLQDLQEATQSHKVNRGTGTSENSQKSQETPCKAPKKLKKRGRPKKLVENNVKKPLTNSDVLNGPAASQENVRTDMSLILIDDADIVFEQDDGFSSAIVQLVQCSKRPVILVTSSLICPHLQRFQQNGKILRMYPLLPRMLGTWLDLMCLADNGTCWPGVGAKFLNYFRGDIRKTINYLQFYTSAYATNRNSDEDTASQNIDHFKVNIDDENSGMSWADHENSEGRKCSDSNNIDRESNYVWNDFIDKHSNILLFKQPLEIFNIWWSVPCLLGIVPETETTTESLKDETVSINTLEAVANAIDAISLTDYFSHSYQGIEYNIACEPWHSTEGDSVCEQENLDDYVRSYDVSDEISHTLVTGSILTAQSILSCHMKTNLHSPGMTLHRQKDRVLSRHKTLTSYLNPTAVLDRRALALDYWPTCRAICRIEKCKTDVNIKRNNRFCHYLKGASVLCRSDTFDKLCDSLHSNESNELSVTNLNE